MVGPLPAPPPTSNVPPANDGPSPSSPEGRPDELVRALIEWPKAALAGCDPVALRQLFARIGSLVQPRRRDDAEMTLGDCRHPRNGRIGSTCMVCGTDAGAK